MPFCPQCGAEIDPEAKFCVQCGQAYSPPPPSLLPVKDPLAAPPYRVQIKQYLGQGWELFKEYPGGFIGFVLLYFLITGGLNIIPFIGGIASFIIAAPLKVGPWIVAARLLQKRPRRFGEFFAGFRYFWSLLALEVVVFLIILGLALPCIITGVLFFVAKLQGGSLALWGTLVVITVIFAIAWVLALIYLGVAWLFSSLLVVDRNMGFWQAMEYSRKAVNRNWFGVFGFVLVLGLIILAAVAPLLLMLLLSWAAGAGAAAVTLIILGGMLTIGALLVLIPFSWGALTAAYGDIFGFQKSEF